MLTETIMIAAAAGAPCAIAGFALGRLTGLAGLRNELESADATAAKWLADADKLRAERDALAVKAAKFDNMTDRDPKTGRFVSAEEAA